MTFLSDISEASSTFQGPIDLKQLLTDSWHPAKRVHTVCVPLGQQEGAQNGP